MTTDTIAAIATPPGRGGIGVVRLSGARAVELALTLLSIRELEAGRARFCAIVDPETGVRLDEAVVTYFRAPRSYTGEDAVEIAAHGAPVLLHHLLRLLVARGARLAGPGEFTERAFLSGRLDLLQAEGVRGLIEAQTLLQAQTAAEQLGGGVSRRVAPVKEQLLGLIAQMEAGIDFAEDDTPVLAERELRERLAGVREALEGLERSFARGRLIAEGVKLVIVGRPNVGKSSLFNRLLGRERSIVTAEPGTTRDTVGERLEIGGIPVELLDTAGLREGATQVERMGITRSREAFAEAGLVLLVLDGAERVDEEEVALLEAAAGRPMVVALNKADLREQADVRRLRPGIKLVRTSALTGEGVESLRASLKAALMGDGDAQPEAGLLTNLRQHGAVRAGLEAVSAAEKAAELPHEFVLLDLHAALVELDRLTGATTTEDVLQRIFSTFCIGK